MPEPVSFNEIDFEAVEYRNEYRHTKAAFALMATQIYAVTTGFNLLFKTAWWWKVLGAIMLAVIMVVLLELYMIYKTRVIITGQSIILRRPFLKDIEIAYSEIGEVQVNNMVIREAHDPDLGPVDLAAANRKWAVEKQNSARFLSRDGKRKISIHPSLENIEEFFEDLTTRWKSAIDRYQGYAKGTSLRQPERFETARAELQRQREERLLRARPSEDQLQEQRRG